MNQGIYGLQEAFLPRNLIAGTFAYSSKPEVQKGFLGWGNNASIAMPFHLAKDYEWKWADDCTVFTISTFGASNFLFNLVAYASTTTRTFIDWGDGSTQYVNAGTSTSTLIPHRYIVPGEYTIILKGETDGVIFTTTNASATNCIVRVYKFDPRIKNTAGELLNTNGFIQSLPKSFPTGVTNLTNCFRQSCFRPPANGTAGSTTSINNPLFVGFNDYDCKDMSEYDFSSVTTLANAFQDCNGFDCDVSKWRFPNATSLSNTFSISNNASNNPGRFTGRGGLDDWTVDKVTTFAGTFFNQTLFDPPSMNNWQLIANSNITAANMFDNCVSFTGAGLDTWNTSGLATATNMFNRCLLLDANLSGWNTANLVTMTSMFNACSSFKGDGLEYWNTSKINTLNTTFAGCSTLNVNFSGWDTSNVTNMSGTFNGCSIFEGSGIEYWNTNRITTFASIFNNCYNLGLNSPIDLSSWQMTGVGDCSSMFACSPVTTIPFQINMSGWKFTRTAGTTLASIFAGRNLVSDIIDWNTSGVTSLASSFSNCPLFSGGDVANWDVRRVTTAANCFASTTASGLKDIDLGNWELSTATNLSSMFAGQHAFKGNGLTNWATSTNLVTNYSAMFRDCYSLGTVSGWNIRAGANLSSIFANTAYSSLSDTNRSGLASSGVSSFYGNLYLPNWTISGSTTSLQDAFFNAYDFTGSGLDSWNTSGVSNLQSTFRGTKNFNASNLNNWDVRNVTITNGMFIYSNATGNMTNLNWAKCTSWNQFMSAVGNAIPSNGSNINCSGWKFASGLNVFLNQAFRENISFNNSLADWDFTECNSVSVQEMFRNGPMSWSGQGLESWKGTNKITNMSLFYAGQTYHFNPDFSNWDVSNLTQTRLMFENALGFEGKGLDKWNITNWPTLQRLLTGSVSFNQNLSGWNTSNQTDMSLLFAGCYAFHGSGLEYWDTSKVNNMANLFFDPLRPQEAINYTEYGTSHPSSIIVQVYNSVDGTKSLPYFNWYNLSGWNTSSVTSLAETFRQQKLTGDELANWDVSKVATFGSTFAECTGLTGTGIGNWNIGPNTSMVGMFQNCLNFDGSAIQNWNVTGVTTMRDMFAGCSGLNSNFANWNICKCTSLVGFMSGCDIGSTNYDTLLNSWSINATGNPVQPWFTGMVADFGNSKYTSAGSGARDYLINYGWTITDGGPA